MNLCPGQFISEVERNKKLLRSGDRLLSPGGSIWTISEVEIDGFMAQDEEEEDFFWFESLGIGWGVVSAKLYKSMEINT